MAVQLVQYIFCGAEITPYGSRTKLPALSIRTAPRAPDCDAETIAIHEQRGADWKWGRRCAVPVGYYPVERLVAGMPQAWHVRSADGTPFWIAGVHGDYKFDEHEPPSESCSLLNVRARGHKVFDPFLIGDGRMPLLLAHGQQEQWVLGSIGEAELLIGPMPAHMLVLVEGRTPVHYSPVIHYAPSAQFTDEVPF